MRVLVTGSRGQLARSLMERGHGRRGLEIVALGKPDLDLEIPGSASDAIRTQAPDVIINAAAYTAVDKAEDEPARAFRVNGEAAEEIAEAARHAGARIIQISTDYVFDGSSPEPYREDAPTGPLGVYGASKLAGEEGVRRATSDHLIARTAWVYSPFGHNFVKTMLALALERDEVSVVDDQLGNPTSALDLADALFRVLDDWSTGGASGLGRTYHLAGSGAASWFEIAGHIFEQARGLGLASADVRPIRTEDRPTRARRPRYSMLDGSRFSADFDYRMPDWRGSVSAVVERLANQPAGA
ncbi:MAG TPA: dTDP-4-dehydrorhamnose reductase [Allosphingosinicella sp.]